MKKILFLALSLFSLAQAVQSEGHSTNSVARKIVKRSICQVRKDALKVKHQEKAKKQKAIAKVIKEVKELIRRPLSGAEVGLEKDGAIKDRVHAWQFFNRDKLKTAGVKIDTSESSRVIIWHSKIRYANGDTHAWAEDIGYETE